MVALSTCHLRLGRQSSLDRMAGGQFKPTPGGMDKAAWSLARDRRPQSPHPGCPHPRHSPAGDTRDLPPAPPASRPPVPPATAHSARAVKPPAAQTCQLRPTSPNRHAPTIGTLAPAAMPRAHRPDCSEGALCGVGFQPAHSRPLQAGSPHHNLPHPPRGNTPRSTRHRGSRWQMHCTTRSLVRSRSDSTRRTVRPGSPV